MNVWAIANQKGGVGKTTTTVALGGLLAAWGSLSGYFGHDPDALEDSSYTFFEAAAAMRPIEPAGLVRDTVTEGLGLVWHRM